MDQYLPDVYFRSWGSRNARLIDVAAIAPNGQSLVPYQDWPIILEAWSTCLRALKNDKERKHIFESLSRTQAVTLALLEEWWNANLSADSQKWRTWMENPMNHDQVPKIHDSEYHKQLSALWTREFGEWRLPVEIVINGQTETRYEMNWDSGGRVLARSNAAIIAAAHRTAVSCLADMGVVNFPRTDISSSYPQDFGPENWPTPLSACIQSCPWLEQGNSLDIYPYFLWDRQTKRTLHLPLGQTPEYMVVSHTWGRWRRNSWCNGTAKVEGVNDWKVPRNSIFDVTELPLMLSKIPFGPRYIWLDLLCIPQDNSPLGRREISRQATIFSSAKVALIWFNRVPTWSGMDPVIDWLSIEYMQRYEAHDPRLEALRMQAASEAGGPTGLAHAAKVTRGDPDSLWFADQGVNEAGGYSEPDGWFTSLWTLQEAFLRPDMFLCDSSWRILSTAKGSRAVQLDHLIALFNMNIRASMSASLPLGVYEIAGIFTRTALHKLLDMSMSDVLQLGNQRYCRDSNRALAIMSALGVTSWFESDSKQKRGTQRNLVEGRYPLEFVREAKEKCGALLFAMVDLTGLARDNFLFDSGDSDIDAVIIDTRLRATMLPFSSDARRQRITLMDNVGTEDHDSVRDWVITADGSIKMRSVGIAASWVPRRQHDDTSGIQNCRPRDFMASVSFVGLGERIRADVNINEWLGSFRPGSEKHAIYLCRKYGETYCGVILERVYMYPGQMHFVKLGSFWTTAGRLYGQTRAHPEHGFLSETDVEWLVI